MDFFICFMLECVGGCLQVFAVDLEAHSVFTYQAMPCLLQIAVDSRCFVVDLLALHDSISILKAPFENSNVLKLLHGSAADLKWLQQLDIYPVNVLDTCALAEVRCSLRVPLDKT